MKERMMAHRDNKYHVQWCLEDTTNLLVKKFPASNVLVVKPCEMSLGTFSTYSNFVKFDELGVPRHKESDGAWAHLQQLTHNAFQTAQNSKVIPEDKSSKPKAIQCHACIEHQKGMKQDIHVFHS